MSESPLDEQGAEGISATAAIGETLRQAREQLSLSIDQVSTQLNITSRYIVALETDQLERLPGGAFVRGYLRSYARLLGVDGDALVQQYNQSLGEGPERSVTTITKVRPQATMADPLVRTVAVILLLALVGFSLWWWQAQTEPSPAVVVPPSAVPQLSSEPEAASPEVAPAVSAASFADGDTDTAAPLSVDAEESEPTYLTDEETARLAAEMAANASSAQDESTEPAAAEALVASEETTAEVELSLEFVDECWVTVKSQSGRTLVARIFNAGDRLSLSLSEPAELLVGRVSAVNEARFAGENLALDEAARQNVARITLRIP
ncbi:RodZ domain-containing protein [Motiliproteus sediminis]|uniref:RodZ domain-containing protein n=1 Tax=Motiliproteus sediminis TaxID=1468178 RepID=UPI001AF00367